MQMTFLVPSTCLDDAITTASELGAAKPFEGLRAPLTGAAEGVLSDIWQEVVKAIRKGYELGSEKAQPFLNEVMTRSSELLDAAGTAAKDIAEALRERLQKLVRAYIDNALAMLRPDLSFGNRELSVKSVQVAHKVVFGGNIAFSIENAFTLVSSGELTVSATYE